MPIGHDTLSMVSSTAAMMRIALTSSDLRPLRDFTRVIESRGGDVEDVFAAAGQAVLDGLIDVPYTTLHDSIRSVAELERAVLARRSSDQRTTLRTTIAG